MESSPISAVPVEPAAPYLGGKRILARRIIARLAEIPHATYAEPFVGMGGVFLRRPFRARAEVINDISTDVANLFRILQRHYVQLMDTLRWQVTSRAEFERLKAAAPDTLTDLERAARFLYLQRTTFGGKVEGRSFGVNPVASARFDVTKLGPALEAIHDRLAGVVIERLPYADFLRRYDRPGTLFYLDPPYFDCEGDYGPGVFGREDFERLAELLAGLQGRFLLSINDRPEIRRIFRRFAIEEVPVRYQISGGGGTLARELLVATAR
ncbi:DNA adenine methylase [Falsiroseomonas selenitidurans]|uniref:site-specific DNA-methyltransferase (adenine-specific) n=1 Tax=Falsiroseomonas selenitidurans TaxID=2716335 RepID=A0ABX1E323_9PROT|nr:DNA adenine methylase [Falsiroseomonas selenitidurans]NKC30218.1 DNA adenine methylase [Falsiroseomonas selenitidurans]